MLSAKRAKGRLWINHPSNYLCLSVNDLDRGAAEVYWLLMEPAGELNARDYVEWLINDF